MKEKRCEVCSEEKAVIRYQTLTGEIIDVCYECFKLLVEERNNVKPKVLVKVIKGEKK